MKTTSININFVAKKIMKANQKIGLSFSEAKYYAKDIVNDNIEKLIQKNKKKLSFTSYQNIIKKNTTAVNTSFMNSINSKEGYAQFVTAGVDTRHKVQNFFANTKKNKNQLARTNKVLKNIGLTGKKSRQRITRNLREGRSIQQLSFKIGWEEKYQENSQVFKKQDKDAIKKLHEGYVNQRDEGLGVEAFKMAIRRKK